VVVELRREVDVKTYEIADLTNKLTAATEEVRRLGNTRDELVVA
jgi:hypothetical protein